MKKYNLSNIMKRAWHLFNCWKGLAKRFPNEPLTSFSGCLKQAWDEAKRAITEAERKAKEAAEKAKREAENKARGAVRMHYGEYKRNYENCRTVPGSYDKATKTIEVFVNEQKSDYCWFTNTKANRRACIR